MGCPPPPEQASLCRIWNRMLDVVGELDEKVKKEFDELIPQYDAYFLVDAQRGGDGDTPARKLWFEVDSLQFVEASPWANPNDPRARARVYVQARPPEEEVEL